MFNWYLHLQSSTEWIHKHPMKLIAMPSACDDFVRLAAFHEPSDECMPLLCLNCMPFMFYLCLKQNIILSREFVRQIKLVIAHFGTFLCRFSDACWFSLSDNFSEIRVRFFIAFLHGNFSVYVRVSIGPLPPLPRRHMHNLTICMLTIYFGGIFLLGF